MLRILPDSLVARLLLATLGSLLLACLAAVLVERMLMPLSPVKRMQAELLDEIEEGMRTGADGAFVVALPHDKAVMYEALPKDMAYEVVDVAGRVLHRSPGSLVLTVGDTTAPSLATLSDVSHVGLHIMRRRVDYQDQPLIVTVACSDRLVNMLGNYSRQFYLHSGLATGLVSLCIFVAGVLLTTRRLVQPIREISLHAAQIDPQRLSTRLDPDNLPKEVKPLVLSFNQVLDRLEHGFRVQQEFLATAAHELKTPLALIRAELELGGAADVETLTRDVTLMGRQVGQLLHLAEASEGHNYRFAPVMLPAILSDAVDYLARLAEQRRVQVALRVDGSVDAVEADAGAVFILGKNLLENALHHAPAGTTVVVRIDSDGFSVRDQGPGVPAYERTQLFRRFWRGGQSRSENGAGLGLAICRQICLAHGWRVRLDETLAGDGAAFVVETGGNR